MNRRALIALSGGVDSSVSAALTQQAGYDCTGVTMRLFDDADLGLDPNTTADRRSCCSLADVEYARAAAARMNMPFYVWDMSADFRRAVIEHFVDEYIRGRTPNPCIECNRVLKFELLLARAAQNDFDVLVTGHYARVGYDDTRGRWVLRKGLDADKDQSYVLYTLTQPQLAHLRLPLGEMTKPQVRALAAVLQLANADKPDSQNICFVPDGDYAAFIEQWAPDRVAAHCPPGDFLDPDGNVIGRHAGIHRYTLGQRKGLGSFGRPVYVRAIDTAANTVTLGDDAVLAGRDCRVRRLNWVALSDGGVRPGDALSCHVKIGYRHPEARATITADPTDPDAVRVRFDEAQRAITPGQAAVFYDDDLVLGGGTIADA
ncbi:MAG: tRNA 2-thiouridine(34) synthase MnmA [Actinomycetes bacterium]|jgi:tRNA-specific 2-thiouridylase|nr:tRNA 2-thiouridine(34) synthase MnmA [Actinomycetes bacterium]